MGKRKNQALIDSDSSNAEYSDLDSVSVMLSTTKVNLKAGKYKFNAKDYINIPFSPAHSYK